MISFQIRECDEYKDEYKNCTSYKDRFQQYFVFGEYLDCEQWNKDYKNCCKLEEKDDWQAGVDLIVSEKKRRDARFKNHYANNIWTKRSEPPANWAAPLPEWMQERDAASYLAVKNAELKGEAPIKLFKKENSLCVIM